MQGSVEIVTIDSTNVAERGFFCYKSKPKSEGYRRKLGWLEQRLAEGMRIKILYENGRSVGFIEYIPAEFAWRAVHAPGYLLVHCLWVVGRAKKKGYGSRLLSECLEDAKRMHMRGVAMVTSSGNWLAGSKLLLNNGFERVDQAPPSFELLVQPSDNAQPPSFPQDWEARLSRYGSGLTIVRSDQCPYLEDVTNGALDAAAEVGVQGQVVELHSAQDVQNLAPSAYGAFNIVYNGKLLSYHWVTNKELLKRLEKHR